MNVYVCNQITCFNCAPMDMRPVSLFDFSLYYDISISKTMNFILKTWTLVSYMPVISGQPRDRAALSWFRRKSQKHIFPPNYRLVPLLTSCVSSFRTYEFTQSQWACEESIGVASVHTTRTAQIKYQQFTNMGVIQPFMRWCMDHTLAFSGLALESANVSMVLIACIIFILPM